MNMKKSLVSTMALVALLLVVCTPAHANFSGAFAPGNWSVVNSNSNGTVNTGGAPSSILINGSDNGTNAFGYIQYVITMPAAGKLCFDWAFQSFDRDGASFDPAGYVINGVYTQLSNDGGATVQSGNACVCLNAGQQFGFRVNSTDNLLGRATFNISALTFTPDLAVCKSISVSLNALGSVSISGADVNNGSSVGCGTPSFSVSPSTFSCANIGSNAVTLTVTDGAGYSVACNTTVIVKDDLAPFLSCAGTISQPTDPNQCGANVTVPSPTVSDNCTQTFGGAEMVFNGTFNAIAAGWNACGNLVEAFGTEATYGGSSSNRVAEIDHEPVTLCQNISGFQIGKSYTLTFRASRRIPSPATVGAVVTIDGGALNVSVNRSNTTFNLTPESFSFVATQTTHQLTFVPTTGWGGTLGLIVDDISIKQGTLSNSFNNGVDASGNYPVGSTTVVWTATDLAGNTSSCSQIVTVVDTQFPTLSGVPNNVTVSCDNIPSLATVTATDNCSVGAVSGYEFPSSSMRTNVVHYFPYESNGNDAQGSAAGTLNLVNFGTGILGNAAIFGGVNSYINYGTSASISGTTPFAISAWVKTSSAAGQTVIQQRDANYIGEYMVNIGANHAGGPNYPGQVYFMVFGSGGFQFEIWSAARVDDGQWHHIVAEREGLNGRIFIDGVLDGSATGPSVESLNPTISTFVGMDRRDFNKPFNGAIDNIRIFTASNCPSNYDRERTWQATDASNNKSAAQQMVHVQDVIGPVLSGSIPGGAQGSICKSAAPAAPSEASIAALYTDNCSTVNATLDGSSGVSGDDCSWTATYTYHISDACGNTADDAVVVYTGGDVTPPYLAAPADMEICYETASYGCAVNLGSPTTSDNCSVGTPTNDAPACFQVGITTVTWTVSDACGHTVTATQTVRRNAQMFVDLCASPSRRIVRGTYNGQGPFGPQSVQLSSTVSGGTPGYSYSWSPSSGLSSATSANPTASPSATTTYTLTVTDSKGCTKQQSITIIVVQLSSIVCGTAPANQGGFKVNVCHVPPGNSNNPQNICISINAVSAHLTGGSGHANCYLGTCISDNCTSTSSAKSDQDDHGFEHSDLHEEGNILDFYPNPVFGVASFHFTLQSSSHATLNVFDAAGRLVQTAFDGDVVAHQSVTADFVSTNLSSGIYYYTLQTTEGILSGKLTLIKD